MIHLGEFKIGEDVYYAANFHNDNGTIEDPTSPEAQLGINGSWSVLTAPAKQNGKTGHFGGTITTGTLAAGRYLIRMQGAVTTAKTVACEFSFDLVSRRSSDLPTLTEIGGIIGSRVINLTIKNSVTSDPLPEVIVTVWNSALTAILLTVVSDTNGLCTLGLDDGTYNLAFRKTNVAFTTPQVLSVTGNTDATYYGTVNTATSPVSTSANQYFLDLRRLLHDATGRFWDDAELLDYINKARKITAAQTLCTRQLATVNIISAANLAQATYSFDTIVPGRRVIDVLDVMLQYSSNTTYQMIYHPFQEIIRTEVWQYQMPGTPRFYTVHNRSVIILQWPNQAYNSSKFDCAVEPLDLTSITDTCYDLPFPFTECVAFYAAYLAKLKDQRRQEAEAFLADYERRKAQAIGTLFTRRLIGI